MRKGSTGLNLVRLPAQHSDNHKEDHFSYFQSLEQKLLQESDKLTSLIGIPTPPADTRSLKASSSAFSSSNKMPPSKTKHKPLQEIESQEVLQQKQTTTASMLVQNYILSKKGQLGSSKSQYFFPGKDKDSQVQRKLTYNMVRPPQQTTSQHSFTHTHAEEISPSKSEKISDHLKKTASTTSSAVLRTIDKIKRMHSLGTRGSLLPSKFKGPAIQDFQILKYIEEGQFGAVYLAVHQQTKFVCALKKIPKKIFEGESRFINQLARQIKIQSYLDHPNIVQLYGFFNDEEHLYLMLEPCCGGNVYTSLKKEGRFNEQKVRTMVRQISHAIEFMHDSDIIHRDIKPENILLHEVTIRQKQQIVKVCDFGWSIHSPLLRDTRCGTPLYSSPEVVQKQHYDNKVDVWNIGILTYELLYGRVPFEIRNQEDLVKVVDEEIYFPKGLPITNDAKDFIQQCLIKNPKERPAMNKLVDHPFILV